MWDPSFTLFPNTSCKESQLSRFFAKFYSSRLSMMFMLIICCYCSESLSVRLLVEYHSLPVRTQRRFNVRKTCNVVSIGSVLPWYYLDIHILVFKTFFLYKQLDSDLPPPLIVRTQRRFNVHNVGTTSNVRRTFEGRCVNGCLVFQQVTVKRKSLVESVSQEKGFL